MLEFTDPVTEPGVALLRVLVAGLLGGLIGIERERAKGGDDAHHFAGVRTFPIFAIVGALTTLASGEVGLATAAGFVAIASLIVVAYVRSSGRGELGATTETAALAAYWVGVAAGAGALLLAGAVAIGVAMLLAGKERLEAFPRALTNEELRATLTLAAIAAVILPVLPDRGYGPWDVWNPRRLWLMVVIVCALSFAGFVAMRLWGHARGLVLSGLLGGLVSSTAATVSFATRSREQEGAGAPLAVAAGLASLVMLGRVAVLVALTTPSLLLSVLPFLAASAAAGGLVVLWLARRSAGEEQTAPDLKNPFSLKGALKFALIYALVLLLVEASSRTLGSWGVVAAAIIAGLTDIDAITLSLAARSGTEMGAAVAATGIALAALSNTAAKAAFAAWIGRGAFRRGMLLVLGAAFVAGAAALVVMRVLAA